MSTISLEDPKALEQLKALLGTNEEILFTDGGKVIAKVEKLTDLTEVRLSKRIPGRWRDKFGPMIVAPDFDDELPDSFWLGEE